MRPNHLKGRDGDRINAVPAAAGHNFGLLLRWLEPLFSALIETLLTPPVPKPLKMPRSCSSQTTSYPLNGCNIIIKSR